LVHIKSRKRHWNHRFEKPYFAAILDFTMKLEVFFSKEESGTSYQLAILQRPLVPNFKFLCHLIGPKYFEIPSKPTDQMFVNNMLITSPSSVKECFLKTLRPGGFYKYWMVLLF